MAEQWVPKDFLRQLVTEGRVYVEQPPPDPNVEFIIPLSLHEEEVFVKKRLADDAAWRDRNLSWDVPNG